MVRGEWNGRQRRVDRVQIFSRFYAEIEFRGRVVAWSGPVIFRGPWAILTRRTFHLATSQDHLFSIQQLQYGACNGPMPWSQRYKSRPLCALSSALRLAIDWSFDSGPSTWTSDSCSPRNRPLNVSIGYLCRRFAIPPKLLRGSRIEVTDNHDSF